MGFMGKDKHINYGGKESFRMMKVPKEGSFDSFVSQFKQKLKSFSKHLFDAKWQAQQFRTGILRRTFHLFGRTRPKENIGLMTS